MCEENVPDRIERLIAGSLSGKLTPGEQEELDRWSEDSPRNREWLRALDDPDALEREALRMGRFDADRAWEKVQFKTRRRRTARIALPAAGIAAAMVLLAGIYWMAGKEVQPVEVALVPREKVDSSNVRLYRSTGEVVAVDSVREIELGGAHARSDARNLTLSSTDRDEDRKPVYNTLTVPAQKSFGITLADGTEVMLNAGSRLRFPDRFRSKAPREVYLDGEAYFRVSKDIGRPFIVHTGGRYVRVTGTQFNLSCYDGGEQVTTLVEGSVRVGYPGTPEETALTPGMQSVQGAEGIVTRRVDVTEYTAWMEGVFSFRERQLGEIMQTIGRWYGCRVVFENPALRQVRFTGKIARSCTPVQIAEFFRNTSDVTVEAVDGTLVIR